MMLTTACPMSASLLSVRAGSCALKRANVASSTGAGGWGGESLQCLVGRSWPVLNHFRSGAENITKISQS